jgi:polysaccharide export outer membrane protein
MNRLKFFTPLILLSLSSCGSLPSMYLDSNAQIEQNTQAVDEASYTLQPITPEVVARMEKEFVQFRGGRDVEYNSYQYRVGPRDVLSVTVYEHPELTIPAGQFRAPDAAGHRVDSRGYIFFPYIGETRVSNLTVGEIRRKLAEKLSSHIPNPQLDVRVAAYNSQKVTVTGEVKTPDRLPITDEAMTVVRAISLSGGNTENADLTSVRVVRGKQNYQVDVESYLQLGELSQNMLLRGGDVLHVPDQTANQIFIMGELKTPKSIPMKKRRMTLAQAIGEAGSTTKDSDIRKVFVIRGVGEIGQANYQVFQTNLETVEGMVLAGRFPMRPRDVVYVSTNGLTKFSRIVDKIFPYLRGAAVIDDLIN